MQQQLSRDGTRWQPADSTRWPGAPRSLLSLFFYPPGLSFRKGPASHHIRNVWKSADGRDLWNVAGTKTAWAPVGQDLVLYGANYGKVLDPESAFSGSDRVNMNKL